MFSRLEHCFVSAVGKNAVSVLSSSLAPSVRILTIGGDQLTGKSTLARDLARRLHAPHVSAGAYFRAIARERGLNVAELSKLASAEAGAGSIDTRIEYETCKTIMSGLVGGTAPLLSDGSPSPTRTIVIEGRNPAVMAAYCATLGRTGVVSVYLSASPRVQARRFISREVDAELSQAVDALLPARPLPTLCDVAAALVSVAADTPAAVEAVRDELIARRGSAWAKRAGADTWTADTLAHAARALALTQTRDEDDRKRFLHLYGLPVELDYRSPGLYDVVHDTSADTPEDTMVAVEAFLANHPIGSEMVSAARAVELQQQLQKQGKAAKGEQAEMGHLSDVQRTHGHGHSVKRKVVPLKGHESLDAKL